jgi:Uma2 family endonuclease
MAIKLNTRKFTISKYHQMAEKGIFLEDDRIELIKGEIIQISLIGSRHAACVRRLTQLFFSKVRTKCFN